MIEHKFKNLLNTLKSSKIETNDVLRGLFLKLEMKNH